MEILDQIGHQTSSSNSSIPTNPNDSRFDDAKRLIREHDGNPREVVLELAKKKGMALDPNFDPMSLMISLLQRRNNVG